jgi:hypothetical protein
MKIINGLVRFAIGGALGGIMSSGGITSGDWQFYAVIACVAASCIAEEVMK